MKSTDCYADRVVDYIHAEYGIDLVVKLMTPEYADAVYSILHLHEINRISVQTTAINLVNFLKQPQPDKR